MRVFLVIAFGLAFQAPAPPASLRLFENVPSPIVASLTISPSTPSIGVGRTLAFSALAHNAAGNPVAATVGWSGSSAVIATINSVSGLLTAVSPGFVTVTARSGIVTASTIVTVTASPSVVAELPRVFLNTAYIAPTGANRVVSVGGDLQAALNSANPGDQILLAPGATFSGNFTLPAKSGTRVIHIRTNVPYANLPAEGTRITPGIAASLNLAKIVTNNGASTLVTATGASNYRLIGVELSLAAAQPSLNAVVRLGDPAQVTLDSVSTNLVLDRVYIHGDPGKAVTRGVILSSASTAVIDSYISDFHANGQDTQGLVGWNGPGPYKIVNNYIEAAGENVMFGGADSSVPNLTPSDIEVRRNYFFKPIAWRQLWTVKNLFELKNAQRVLVEGNIFSNNWVDGQVGYAINFKSVNQDGSAPWSKTTDVTFRYNIVTNSGGGMTLLGQDENPVTTRAQRIVIQDNIFHNINIPPNFDGIATFMQILCGVRDVIIDHNTFVSTGVVNAAVVFDVAPAVTFLTYTNNIVLKGAYGIKGSGQAEGSDSLSSYAIAALVQGNAFIGATASVYPAGNFFPADVAGVHFVNYAATQYKLAASSLLRNAGMDGRDVGADVDQVASKTAGIVVP